ncbi:hypothetical protein [Leeuwenhoekiella palythoae]|uniref:Cobalt/nickel transport protein n=1 Tax=Leeuwenhoekiella palythoae TaxID=573501 RepID=A0A1M5VZL2_9FLAO|nr:hypothetical protein [Leeuwenhoekiella palythoae]RXG31127.1 hypothetical protein DSM01_265 [Leeuwenhoekiella palythoae]SHH80424.1 hypothetical protein SAMN04487999_0972 [Leeuwenhoekiella palythoae]
MRSKLYTYVVTLILIAGAAHIGYGQGAKEPPEPQVRTGDAPPFGLPTPIDDYIPHLLIFGVFMGGYFFYKAERQKVTNS